MIELESLMYNQVNSRPRASLGAMLSALLFLFSPSVYAQAYVKVTALDNEGFRDVFVQVAPNVFVAGQPTPEGLARAQKMGVKSIVNLRNKAEMSDPEVVSFDEAATVRSLEMTYLHLPSGGPEAPYSKELLEEFATILDHAKSPILLHCGSAYRATHMWTAYLIKHQGWSAQQAINVARQINFGTIPLEGF